LKKKRDRVKVTVSVDREVYEALKQEFGDLGTAVRKLGEQFLWSLGPRDPELRRAWEALQRHVDEDGRIKWCDAEAVVKMELGVDRERAVKVLQELGAQGYLETVDTGVLKVHRKRVLPPELTLLLGLR